MEPITWPTARREGFRIAGVGSGTIESLKWLGLIAMVAEHWMRFVVGELPSWLYLCGRMAFPLFAFALALGLAGKTRSQLRATTLRAFIWALVAQACMQLMDAPDGQLNVLFTFGLGLALVDIFDCVRSPFFRAVALFAAAAVAIWCEFGIVGVAFVAGAVALCRAQVPPAAAWAAVLGLLVALAIPNGNHFALVALPVAILVWRFGIVVPRVRGLFYWAYALQFPVYSAARLIAA